ncbi:MAG: site-2 protease family protein [Epsilonproteobacteria bacterium]|nr:site-2 protease family protein [Campylobacterota bacterium]
MSDIKIIETLSMILALMIAIIGHEIMHGYIAYRYGDDTAKRAGRLSINPIVHIDPVGTILIPAILYFTNAPFLFGWAKPVPVNISIVIRNGGYGAAIAVALAGITYNLLVAIFAATILPLFLHPNSYFEAFMFFFLYNLTLYNVILAVFNLWPIPPLDGSQALYYLAMKLRWDRFVEFYEKIYPYGMLILFAILFIPGINSIIFAPAEWILKMILP